jgi:hypothetical protein
MTLFLTSTAKPYDIADALRRTSNQYEPGMRQPMTMRKLGTTVVALLSSNGRLTRWTASRGRSWLPVSAIPMVMCAVVIAAVAQNQTGTTQVQPGLTPPPYWAYAANPSLETSHAEAKPVDGAPRQVQGSESAFTLAQIGDLFNTPDWASRRTSVHA